MPSRAGVAERLVDAFVHAAAVIAVPEGIQMRPRSIVLAAFVVSALAIGCSSSPFPSAVTPTEPAASPSSVPNPSTPPSSAPTASTAPSPQPTASPLASAPDDPPPSFSPAESTLLEALRADARVGCAPRRADLPDGAVAGIECHIGTSLVDRVGVYGFDGSRTSSARTAYLGRLDKAGVIPGTGDCKSGRAGDAAWPANVDDVGGDDSLRDERSGCFLDENGIANIRLTCYGEIYMGVLGRNSDIAALYSWSWKVAPNESVDRDPPGLCAAPD